MQRQWYFLYHPKTNTFWMCDTDLARIGDLRCRQCNAITEDNCLLFFGPCTSHRQHHLDYSLRNHKRAVGVGLTRIVRVHPFDTAPTHPAVLRFSAMISQLRFTPHTATIHRSIKTKSDLLTARI